MRCLAIILTLLAAGPALAQGEGFAGRVLAAHNGERERLGVRALVWNERLADDAQAWAQTLARRGRMEHAHDTGQGENLWVGTAGFYSYEQMVGGWLAEKADYRHGTFPKVSRNGRAVGHYTQMVWRGTTQVGCGLASAGGQDFLVCRYSPPGNWVGQQAY
jgi:hypothetical protein